MKKLLIFLMIAIPLAVIFIVNVTVDAVAGIVIIPVDNLSIVCTEQNVEIIYDEDNNISQINVDDISKTVKLGSAIYPEAATNKEVYWESTDENIAVVDRYGIVTFRGFGSVDVYAISSDGTKRKSCMFVVTDTRVHDISIYSDQTVLEIGSSTNIWARVIPSTAINQNYTLISSNPNVIEINSAGVATAISAGEATIIATASDGSVGYNPTVSLTIKVVRSVGNVKLNPEEESLTLATNELRLRAIIAPIDATNKNVTYTTTDPLVATVSNEGVVKFLKAGTVVITVITEDGNFMDSITLTYTGGYPISLNIGNTKIEADVSNGPVFEQINYSFSPANPPIQNITFSSNDESVATVDRNGLIKILGGGTTTITVKVQTSENLYYFSYIEISSKRKIDSINFSQDNVIISGPNFSVVPIYSPIDATEIDFTFLIISGQEYASISETGFVTFNSAGQIVVKVYDSLQPEIFALITITYTGGYPSQVVLDTEEISIKAGEFNYLTFALYPIETSIRQYRFEIISQNPVYGSGDVIELDQATGRITGISGGTAIVRVYVKTAEDQEISKDCLIYVTQDITSIVLDCEEEQYEEKFISANNLFNFSTAIFPLDVTDSSIQYILSDPSIASIVDNNKIYFNQAGVVTLTVYSLKNNNIKATLTFWYTGGCAISASIDGIPNDIINGDSPFIVTLSNIIPANATNRSFKINVSNVQSTGNLVSVTYLESSTKARVTILNSGSATLSFLLANSDGTTTVFAARNITVKQKVNHISFPYSSQTISSTQFNLQCEVHPSNATQSEISYSLAAGYEALASINGSVLTFNPSTNPSETVRVIATLIDIDRSTKTAEMEITTTFGVISAPEGNEINLSVGNSLVYNYSDKVNESTAITILMKSGTSFIHTNLTSNELTITALFAGISEIEVYLVNKVTQEVIEILADLTITITENIQNILFASHDFTKIGSKYVTAQNDLQLIFDVAPETASAEGLIIVVSNPSIAVYDNETGILHFITAGTTEILVYSPDGSCTRSFTVQYTDGAAVSHSLNIESDTGFYLSQNYLLAVTSCLPANANLTITDVSEIILSGSAPGIEKSIEEGNIIITFIKSGTVKLRITLSDGSQKIVSVNVTSTLSEIIFENETILTALSNITLNPILLPASAVNKTLIYSSSDVTIATVSSNGLVTFLKAGTVVITVRSAENENAFAECQVTSTLGYVADFTLNYTDLSLLAGESRNLIVNSYLPVNATYRDFVYEIVSFAANDGSTDPVIVLNGNMITCIKGGTAVVKVSITKENGETIYKLCNITVIRELTSFTVSFNHILDTYQNYFITSLSELDLIITLNPADATITSHSITIDKENIAKIENGKLIFLSEGIVRLTISYNNKLYSAMIRYTQSAVSFEIDDPNSSVINGVRNVEITCGQTYEVRIKNVIPYDLSNKSITLILHLNSPNYNNDICSTSNNNIIVGQKGGSSTYNIMVAGYTSPEKLKVTVIRFATSIVASESIITANSTYPLAAHVLPHDTTDKTLTYTVMSSAEYVSVNEFGVITFTEEATATIRIKNEASGVTKIVTVQYDMGAKEITFLNNINYVFIGSSLTLVTKITPHNVQNEEIVWSVDNPSLATISQNGILTPNNIEGKVKVTAKLKNYPETVATIEITIYARVDAIAFDLKNADDLSFGIAGTRVFGTYFYKNIVKHWLADLLTNQMIMSIKSLVHNSSFMPVLIWTSSDHTVATVDQYGVITVLKAGVVTIQCTPAKQYYSDPSRHVKASYTFTFVDGVNIETKDNFERWRYEKGSSSQYKPLDELDENGNHPNHSAEHIETIRLSKYIADLPGVIQRNIIFDQGQFIHKGIYGNGFILSAKINDKGKISPFRIESNITINNVYFRGYTFESNPSLNILKDTGSLINIHANTDNYNVTIKNCIIDGAEIGVSIKNANATFSGCIIKNTYKGGITVGSENSSRPRTQVTVRNTVIENCLLGCISSEADPTYYTQPPLITLEGSVLMYNWQEPSYWADVFDFGGVLNGVIKSEIRNQIERNPDRLKTVNGKTYVHIGVTCIHFLEAPMYHLEYDFEVVNNTSSAYSMKIYQNNLAPVAEYIFKNFSLGGNEANILPTQTYTTDTLGTYARIRDLT